MAIFWIGVLVYCIIAIFTVDPDGEEKNSPHALWRKYTDKGDRWYD